MSRRKLVQREEQIRLEPIVYKNGQYFLMEGDSLTPVDTTSIGNPISRVILKGVQNIDDLAEEGVRKQGLVGKVNAYSYTLESIEVYPP